MVRSGSGGVRHEREVAEAEKMVSEKLPDLIERMLQLAHGVRVQGTDRKGETDVYMKPPDRQALEYLIDLILDAASGKRATVKESEPPQIKIIEVIKSGRNSGGDM